MKQIVTQVLEKEDWKKLQSGGTISFPLPDGRALDIVLDKIRKIKLPQQDSSAPVDMKKEILEFMASKGGWFKYGEIGGNFHWFKENRPKFRGVMLTLVKNGYLTAGKPYIYRDRKCKQYAYRKGV